MSVLRKFLLHLTLFTLLFLFSLQSLWGASGKWQRRTLTINSLRKRSYYLFIPSSFSLAKPHPIILLVLHGGLGNASTMMKKSGLVEFSERNGYVIAFLEGTPVRFSRERRTWNAGRCCGRASKMGSDDVTYISLVINDLKAFLGVNDVRIVLLGHSNGAMMSYRFICERPEEVYGIISVSGALVYDNCNFRAARDVFILHIHGREDENVPIRGGRGSRSLVDINYPSLIETISEFVKPRKCKLTLQRKGEKTYFSYSCSAGAPVKVVIVDNWGHEWNAAVILPEIEKFLTTL